MEMQAIKNRKRDLISWQKCLRMNAKCFCYIIYNEVKRNNHKFFDTLSSFTYLNTRVANMILSSRTVNIKSISEKRCFLKEGIFLNVTKNGPDKKWRHICLDRCYFGQLRYRNFNFALMRSFFVSLQNRKISTQLTTFFLLSK